MITNESIVAKVKIVLRAQFLLLAHVLPELWPSRRKECVSNPLSDDKILTSSKIESIC